MSGQRKTTSPFQTWNSSPGRNIRNGTLPKCEAKQDATPRSMIGCQDLSKTRWSSHGARRLSPRVPWGIVRAQSTKQRKESEVGVKRRSLGAALLSRGLWKRGQHIWPTATPIRKTIHRCPNYYNACLFCTYVTLMPCPNSPFNSTTWPHPFILCVARKR